MTGNFLDSFMRKINFKKYFENKNFWSENTELKLSKSKNFSVNLGDVGGRFSFQFRPLWDSDMSLLLNRDVFFGREGHCPPSEPVRPRLH